MTFRNVVSMRSFSFFYCTVFSLAFGLFSTVGIAAAQPQAAITDSASPLAERDTLTRFEETIPGTLVTFEMIPVPAGSVTIETPDGPQEVEVGPFWIGKTEVAWDAYDVYVYGLDKENEGLSAEEIDAIARPSKPYVLPGEDFGHKGYPALSMTRRAAAAYGHWLSAKTDRTYRLPTRAEWKHACQLGMADAVERGPEAIAEHAWIASNADGQTHPVGASTADALGLHDVLGNAAEFVADPNPDEDQLPFAWGGSYRTEASEVSCDARIQQTSAWKMSDPQLPKSKWWLSDAPFVGFRLVRVPAAASQP